MKKKIICVIILSVGVLIGMCISWFTSYGQTNNIQDSKALKYAFESSEVLISRDAFKCEGDIGNKVSDVLSSIIAHNSSYIRNKLYYHCGESICSISVSDCTPWQSEECGARVLKFELDNNQPIPDSFSCIDIP